MNAATGYAQRYPPVGPSRRKAPGGSCTDGANTGRPMTPAGSDSSGGAGIQADLKTFAAFGIFGTCAITAITAQNTDTISAVVALSAELVAAQIDAVISDLGADATKIGMLGNAEIVAVVID